MSNKELSVIGKDDILEALSEDGVDSITHAIENNYLEVGWGFCDCEYADTEWEVTEVKFEEETVRVTISHRSLFEYKLLYS